MRFKLSISFAMPISGVPAANGGTGGGGTKPALASASAASLMTKFGTSTVAATFAAMHTYLSDPYFVGKEGEIEITLGDYIDLPSISVDGSAVTNNSTGTDYLDPNELLRLIVVGRNSFNGKNGNGTSAHVVMQFKNIAYTRAMNPWSGNEDYSDTDMQAYIYGTGSGAFWTGLVAAIGGDASMIWAPKRYVNGPNSRAAVLVEDKLWLPTYAEMSGAFTIYETSANQARLEYYDASFKRIKYDSTGSAKDYWLSSCTDGNYFYNVEENGGYGGHMYDETYGVAPAFCVK
jgi:hypothetical protein